MKYWLRCLLIVAVLGGATTANAQEPGLHYFFLLHAVVSNLKKDGDESNAQVLDFYGENPKAAYHLAEFWWKWALRDCRESINETIALAVKAYPSDKEAAEKKIKEERNNCVTAFIFERWHDINDSFANKRTFFARDAQK